jgi:hypothetical protein
MINKGCNMKEPCEIMIYGIFLETTRFCFSSKMYMRDIGNKCPMSPLPMKEIEGGGEKKEMSSVTILSRARSGKQGGGEWERRKSSQPCQNGLVIFAKTNFAKMRKRKNLSTLFYLWLFPIGISLWLQGKAKSVHMVTSRNIRVHIFSKYLLFFYSRLLCVK